MKKILAGIALLVAAGCGSSSSSPRDGAAPDASDDVGAEDAAPADRAPAAIDGAIDTVVADDANASDAAPIDGSSTDAIGADALTTDAAPTTDGAAVMLDDSGKAALAGMDGITGVMNGMAYTFTRNPKVTDYGTEYKTLLLEALAPVGSDEWTLTIPKKPGVYACGQNGQQDDGTSALLGGPGGATAYGVPGSSCTVEVKSTVGHIEGRFVGVLSGFLLMKFPVTSGYFYFSNGLGDCSLAKDPGLAAGVNGATLAVTNIVGKSTTYLCGENATYTATSSNPLVPSMTFNAHANNRDITLTIEGIATTGTFTCGMPGSTALNARHVSLSLGEFAFMEQNGAPVGGCTVNVTEYDTTIAGTYAGTLWSSPSQMHSEMTVQGHFRNPKMFP